MNRKGSALDVLLICVVVFAFGVGFLILHFSSNAIYDKLLNSTAVNSSAKTVTTLQAAKAVTAKLDYYSLAIFIGLTMALIITAWYISANPLFMGIYVIVIFIAVLIAMGLSNAWETISQRPVFVNSLAALPITNNLLSYLPYYVAVIGIIGIIVLFAKPGFNPAGDLGGGRHL
jgi:hypothetical protein